MHPEIPPMPSVTPFIRLSACLPFWLPTDYARPWPRPSSPAHLAQGGGHSQHYIQTARPSEAVARGKARIGGHSIFRAGGVLVSARPSMGESAGVGLPRPPRPFREGGAGAGAALPPGAGAR